MARSFFEGVQSNSASLSLSNVYQVMKGGFGAGETQITSYMTSTTVVDLKRDLITFETLLKDSKWPVSKIIQREVDKSRVREISKNYIENSSDQIRYFPPIVVAILPRTGDLFSDSYIPYEKNDYSEIGYKKVIDQMPYNFNDDERLALLENESSNISVAEGLFIKKPYDENCNYLAWDRNKYYAIVIDGQHRFEALKKSSDISPSSPVNAYNQDVIFIDASAKYFSTGGSITSISIFRKIFMDINKNPVLVSEAKQIIMDDIDPAKLFVQAIVDDTDINGVYIRPELIDWNTNSNKHELPYLTSILNLHKLISDKFLSGKALDSLSSRSDKNDVKKWVNRLNDFLKVDSVILSNQISGVTTLKDSFEEFEREIEIDDDALFNYDFKVLNIALSQFKSNYLKSIVYYFNNLSIYKKLIDYLENKDVFKASSDLRIALLKSPSNREELEEKEVKKIKHELEGTEFVSQFMILYTVVGQKALFDMYFTYLTDARNGILNEAHLLKITTEYVEKMDQIFQFISNMNFKVFGENKQPKYKQFRKKFNDLDSYESISTNFWDDLLYVDEKIKYNQKGVIAIKSIFNYLIECIENRANLDSVAPIELADYKAKTYTRLTEYSITDSKAESLSQKFVDLKLKFIKHIVKSTSA